jgi:hypothetical protein
MSFSLHTLDALLDVSFKILIENLLIFCKQDSAKCWKPVKDCFKTNLHDHLLIARSHSIAH